MEKPFYRCRLLFIFISLLFILFVCGAGKGGCLFNPDDDDDDNDAADDDAVDDDAIDDDMADDDAVDDDAVDDDAADDDAVDDDVVDDDAVDDDVIDDDAVDDDAVDDDAVDDDAVDDDIVDDDVVDDDVIDDDIVDDDLFDDDTADDDLTIDPIDSKQLQEGAIGLHNTIVRRPDGEIVIATVYSNGLVLFHRTTEKTYTVETIDLPVYSFDMSIDGAGLLHLAYYSIRLDTLVYAYETEKGEWVSETIETDVRPENKMALIVDDQGDAHICYPGVDDYAYITNMSGDWETTQIFPAAPFTGPAVCALDSERKIHTAFVPGLHSSLYYATNRTGEMVVEELETVENVFAPAMIIDGEDEPLLAYTSWEDGVHLVTKTEEGWDDQAIGEAATGDIQMKMDADEALHMVLYSSTTAMIYGSNISGDWAFSNIRTGDYFQHVSLTVDENAYSYLAYTGDIEENLYYADNASGDWRHETMKTTSFNHNLSQLVVDNEQNLYFLNMNYHHTTGTLYEEYLYWQFDGDNWVNESAINIDYQDFFTESVLPHNPTGTSHIFYLTPDEPWHIYHRSNATGDWLTEQIFPFAEVKVTQGNSYSMVSAADAEGNLHLAVVHFPDSAGQNGGLFHYTDASGVWTREQLYTYYGYPAYAYIAVAPNGEVGVVYFYPDDYFHVATNDSEGWSYQAITIDESVLYRTRILYDAASNLHVFYIRIGSGGNNHLRHAWRVGGEWFKETVTAIGSQEYSVGLDQTGAMHLVVPLEGGVAYFSRQSGIWQRYWLNVPNLFTRSSLAMIDNQLHVVFSSYNAGLWHYIFEPNGR